MLHAVYQVKLLAEQKADSFLTELFDRIVPASEDRITTQCYFLLGELVVRLWVLHGEQFVGEAVFQVAVPSNLCSKVLQASRSDVACLFMIIYYDISSGHT